MSQGREYSHDDEGWHEHPATVAIGEVVRGHLQALIAELAAHPGPPPLDATGRPMLGPPPLPDDSRELYLRCRAVIRQWGHRVVEFDETTYEGRDYIQSGIAGLTTPEGTIGLRAAGSRNMLLVLLHEYGHLRRRDLARQGHGEYFSEAFSYIVGAYFGVMNPAAAQYIHHIAFGDDDHAITFLTAEADVLTQQSAQMIVTVLGQTL